MLRAAALNDGILLCVSGGCGRRGGMPTKGAAAQPRIGEQSGALLLLYCHLREEAAALTIEGDGTEGCCPFVQPLVESIHGPSQHSNAIVQWVPVKGQ